MILVYLEIRDSKVKKSSLEVLSEAKRRGEELGMKTEAALVGHGVDSLASEAFRYGASKVHILENSLLSRYSPSAYTKALLSLAEEVKPEAILFAATSMGRDLAPRLAAKLGVSLASDCTQASVKDGKLVVVRPLYAGKAFARFTFKSTPQMATLRPNVFPLVDPSDSQGETIKKAVVIPESQVKDRVVDVVKAEGAELDVTEADIIVSGGRGMKGSENFELLRELTSILPHSALGASRSAVDAEWIDHQHQVGQTGKTVSPNLYMAFGISGAIQHLAGMSSSKYIIAVNKDPEAPIFKVADFGIVGDLFQVIPPLKEELKKALSE
ncbi:MAG: electron transfer flavoprotein subunit alpha/FixB family protein [Candidatus Aminicenantes bacterium]|nr:electron transfer flavoprotein subunit alpha/FixB family protein [Candidatus Aminicenantes bacterium]MDH5744593.1 electron transfer flavoprotein subunit alpha/FixB family protein [Candidatus Aminicenantes bacterium]